MSSRRVSSRVLSAISEGLVEIAAHFELEGFSTKAASPGQDVLPGPQLDIDDETDFWDDEFPEKEAFDREDIEIAIDAFLSYLVQAGLMRKINPGSPPELSEVFERFFGRDHEITKKVEVFEEHITGYFGFVGYEDMKTAYAELTEIQAMIVKEGERESLNAAAQGSFDLNPPTET